MSQLGFWFSHISFQDLMADLTEDELWLSALFAATFAPVLIVGPFGGVLVDRLDRKRVLIGAYVAIAVVSAIQVTLVATDNITPVVLLITGAAMGTTLAVLGPAVGAITANTVPIIDLPSAVSLQAMSSNLSRVVGPAMAAPLVRKDLFEASWTIYIILASLALIVVSLSLIHI